MSCSLNDNCCQQSGLCLGKKICKPIYLPQRPWKRFTCECPDGHHGDNCDLKITSCQGYAQGSRKSGKYKIVDSADNSVYEVYCHFGSHRRAWTLVQSASYANHTDSNTAFTKPLKVDRPIISPNALTWSGYRLSKARMQSIYTNSAHLGFTCDFEKVDDVHEMDYLQMPFPSTDIFEHNFNKTTISGYHGQINEDDLQNCTVELRQGVRKAFMCALRETVVRLCQTSHVKTFIILPTILAWSKHIVALRMKIPHRNCGLVVVLPLTRDFSVSITHCSNSNFSDFVLIFPWNVM